MKTLIQVEQGYFSYPKQESLLRNINFSIGEGEFHYRSKWGGKDHLFKIIVGATFFSERKSDKKLSTNFLCKSGSG